MDEKSKPIIPSGDRAIFLAQLLRRRGIPLGVPWRDSFPGLSVRVFNVLDRSGLQTLGEVLQAMRNDGRETALGKNVALHVFDELWEAFEILAGPAVTSYRPSLVAEPAEEIFLNDQSEKDARLLTRRFLDGATLEQLGREQGVSRSAIRIRINRALKSLRARSRAVARKLTGPLIKAMEESGNLIHRDFARKLTATIFSSGAKSF